jgi:hypothetical protein
MLAVAVTGCRHAQSGCATCGGGGPMTASNGTTIIHETAGTTTYTPSVTNAGSVAPMRMPSSNGIQVIDNTGSR